MFTNTMGTSKNVWVPSSGFPSEINEASEFFRVQSAANSDEYILSNGTKGSKSEEQL